MTYDKVPTVDFFTHEALPSPRLTPDQAGRIAAEHFGLGPAPSRWAASRTPTSCCAGRRTPVAMLKIANPAFGAIEIDAQDTAADLIADSPPRTCAWRPCCATRGAPPGPPSCPTDGRPGHRTAAALPARRDALRQPRHLSPRTVAAMGRIAGRVSTALRDLRASRAGAGAAVGPAATPTASSRLAPGPRRRKPAHGAAVLAATDGCVGRREASSPTGSRARPCTWT